jgi:ketosteroid isomerase-like protein
MTGKRKLAKNKLTRDDEQIRELDRLWGEAASTKELDRVVAFYAADASLLWPDTPPVHGTVEIRNAWRQMMASIDGLKLEFIPETITVSADGQIATDYGKVRFEQMNNPYTKTIQTAKYLVVWKKVNDAWKVYFDCYNLNAS